MPGMCHTRTCANTQWQDLVQLLVEDFEADLDGPLSRAGCVPEVLFRTHMGGASLPAGLRAIDYAGYEVICFKRVMIHFQSLHPC